MTLRSRLTLTVAGIVAAAVLVGAVAAWLSAAGLLTGETDRFLLGRAETVGRGAPRPANGGPPPLPGSPNAPPLAAGDIVAQTLDRDGQLVPETVSSVMLPVDAVDVALAQNGGAAQLKTVTVGGVDYRVVTTPLRNGGAVMLARDMSATNELLAGLAVRLVVVAVLVTAAAAGVAWFIGGRLARPIVRLTDAAEEVARTQDVALAEPASLPDGGRDEVGRLANAFRTMLGALAMSREQQRRLVTDASHELRTPLTAIRTNVDFLGRAPNLSDSARADLIAETRLELVELTDLVAELVELATDVRADEAVDDVDLAEVAETVAARFRRRSGRPIEVGVLAGGDLVVQGRPAMLERAVANLVQNAVKYSPPSSPVEIWVSPRRLDVADRGPGIPAEDRVRLFDRFARGANAAGVQGSGLGLAIVAQIAAVHGAHASLHARDGGGLVASLTFPA